jgi:hypothetical protein
MSQPTAKKRMSEGQFRQQWMKAQEEIALLVNRGIALQSLMPALYEGVLGEEAPSFEPQIVWDTEEAVS